MARRLNTVNEVAHILCEAVKNVLEASTGSRIYYAPTIQKVPSISLKPDIGCFVQFSGDYSGLFIMNLSGPAALELYTRSMKFMGLPEEDLHTDYTSDDVVNCIGEFINQVIGKARSMVEARYGLNARNNQPKAITISTAITLSIATMLDRPQCRRLSFKTEDNNPFYVEMNLEQVEFIKLDRTGRKDQVNVQDDIDAMMDSSGPRQCVAASDGCAADIDALMAEFGD
ncbi:MAG TPA: DUF3334 family protein [Thermodesulfobacteriaceae bacterium]|nr:DUF3334 family protein [Thermodesulfobacteriaceae bacterium]